MRINPLRIVLIITVGRQAHLLVIENRDPVHGSSMEHKTMIKNMMIAAALLTMGVSSAFAGEDFPDRYAAPVSHASVAQQANSQSRVFSASTRQTTSVYALFAVPGGTQGGNQ